MKKKLSKLALKRLQKAVKEREKKTKHISDAIRESEKITEKDLRLRIF